MKNFLKVIPLIIVYTITIQETFAQTFAVKGGVNLSNLRREINDANNSNGYGLKAGFHLAATAEYDLSKWLSIESGAVLNSKGSTINEKGSLLGVPVETEGDINLFYLDIPITAKAKFNVGGVQVFGTFGPYIGIGLAGRIKSETNIGGDIESINDPVTWGSDIAESQFRRLDYGLLMGAGVEIKSIQIAATYGLGLANTSPSNPGGVTLNNRVVSLSLGYKFRK